jgi:AcrR family transcriptional regulator
MRNIRAKLAYHNLSVRDLARELNMSEGSLYSKLNSKVKISLNDAVNITNFFRDLGDEVSLEELFELNLCKV